MIEAEYPNINHVHGLQSYRGEVGVDTATALSQILENTQ